MKGEWLRTLADRQRSAADRHTLTVAADELDRLQAIVNGEQFYAIRRTDGEQIGGEYGWFKCEGPNDWTPAEETEWNYGGDAECEIARFYVEPLARKQPEPPGDDEDCRSCWRAEWGGERMPTFSCPDCGRVNCPKADAHVNRCPATSGSTET